MAVGARKAAQAERCGRQREEMRIGTVKLPWYMKRRSLFILEGFCILGNGPLPLSMHASSGRLRMRPWASAESPALSARLLASRPQPSFLRLAEPAAM
jgi:hypothetical protein